MVKIAMLSRWHVHANGYASEVRKSGDAEITCVWDEDTSRGATWAKELGVDFEASLDDLLAREDVEAVIVDTPTADHCRVMVAAADAGKHIFTEKAMALTLDECRQISQAVARNNVKFCISHPQLNTGLIQYARQAIDEGLLGKIHYMRMRTAHNGTLAGWLPDYWYDVEKAGGGAMMDLGCHPMYTAAYLLGKPKRIASMFNTNYCPPPADDNAVSVVEFENGAIAVLETSFISPWQADCFELLGTIGALVAIGKDVKIRSKKLSVDGWVIPDKLPDPKPAAMRMWLDGILHGTPIPFDTAKGEALTELLENAYKSHGEQRIVRI
jgi:1,5-anhydro-D-fructose reductase (1,5-anhydro-D-mannitol-forming)